MNNTKQYKEYNNYKSSGIPWINDIPEHWEKWKVSRAVKNIGSGTTPSSGNREYYDNGSVNWLNSGDLNDGLLVKCKKKITPKAIKDISSLKIFPKGTLTIAMYGATIGKVCIMLFDAATNQACCNIEEGIINNKFLMYWFIAHRPHIVNMSYGGGQPNISQDIIKSLIVPCPLKSEQIQIAKFLDYKTAKIDRFIRKKKQLIKLLNEQKSAIINDAVTKGINPNAKMKASSIEWLGEIPEHWEVKKLKYVASKIVNRATPSTSDNENWNGDINWVTPAEINDITYISNSIRKITEKGYKSCGTFLIPKNAIVLTTRAPIGKLAITKVELCTNQGCKSIIPMTLETKFLYYQLLVRTKVLNSLGTGTTFMELGGFELKNLACIYTSIVEQQQIVEHIEKEIEKINITIETIEKEIELVQEYRTALISEAVTGKIDVRNYAVPNIEPETEEEIEINADEGTDYTEEE